MIPFHQSAHFLFLPRAQSAVTSPSSEDSRRTGECVPLLGVLYFASVR